MDSKRINIEEATGTCYTERKIKGVRPYFFQLNIVFSSKKPPRPAELNQSNPQAEVVAEVPISKRSEDPDPSGHRGIGRPPRDHLRGGVKQKSNFFNIFLSLST
jgi:hypothetical protein